MSDTELGSDVATTELDHEDDMSDTELESGVATTELDQDSSDGDRAAIDVIDITGDVDVMQFWICRVARFGRVREETKDDSRIYWRLLDNVDSVDIFNDQLVFGKTVVDDRLSRGYVGRFKIGITFQPFQRWCRAPGNYAALGYDEFTILAVHDNADFIKDLETWLLKTYRRYDCRGFLVPGGGHHLCSNRQPGGESGDHGIAPFCCYLAVKSTWSRTRSDVV